MRTTLTLEDDVAQMLESVRAQHRLTFDQAVNDALRAGLVVLTASGAGARPMFRIEPLSLGPPALVDVDDIAATLALGEGETHR